MFYVKDGEFIVKGCWYVGGRWLFEEILYYINCLELLVGLLVIMFFIKNKVKV